jgi:basic membrane protein A and related proteins
MKMKRWPQIAALMMALALVLAACGGGDDTTATTEADAPVATEAPAEPLKVAFVFVGPVADQGWNWAHGQGTEAVKAKFGDAVAITVLEDIPEGSDSQRVFEDLAADGNKLIFGNSFGYGEWMLAAAENFPDTVFMQATGFLTSENMGQYFGAAEEARYLSGLAAGAATESNQIGYVAAFPIAEVVRGINAFTLGVREVNPDATVEVVWTSTWFDPPKESTAAKTLLNKGADVIAMHQDSPAPGQAAEEVGAFWVGYNTDRIDFAPNAWLTAPVWDWAPFYLLTVQQVIDGTWVSESYYGNMADGMVGLAPFGPSVSDDTKVLIEERTAEIIDGSFAIFPDPIVNQDGEEVPAWSNFSEDERFFVEGVIGSPTG